MAQNIEIRVKQIGNASQNYFTNGVLDLADDTTLNTIIQLVDIREPDKRATNFVQTFTLPATKRNNQTFQQIYSNGFESFAYNPTKKLDCQILVNGNQYFSGYLQLNSITKQREYVKSYEVTVYAKLGSFFNDLGDNKLIDIISLEEFNHPFTYWAIAQSWGYRQGIKQGSFDDIANQVGNYKDSGGAYQYPSFASPLVSYGLYRPGIYYGGKLIDFQLGNGYVYPLFHMGQTTTEWKTTDFKPAIYVKTLFDKVLKSQGVAYKSEFLNSEYFRRLIIPSQSYLDATSGSVQLTEQQVNDCTVWTRFTNTGGKTPNQYGGTDLNTPGPYYLLATTGTSTGMSYGPFTVKFNDDTTAPSQDTGAQYDPSTGKITIKKAGKYNLTVRLVMRLGIYVKYFGSSGAGGFFSLQGGRNIPVVVDIRNANGKSVSSTNAEFIIREEDYGSGSTFPQNLYLDKEVPVSLKNEFLAAGSQYYVTVSFATTKSDYKYKTFDQSVPFWYIGNAGDYNATMKLYIYANELTGVYNPSEGSKMILNLASTEVADGDTQVMNTFMPDMKAIDLIKNLNKMFNLYWLQQPDGSFLIEPRDDFYKSGGQYVIKDWTYKVDRNEDYKIEPLYDLSSKIYSFTYDKDDTYENNDYAAKYLENYGTKKVEVESDFVDQETETELDFAASPQIDFLDKGVYMTSFTKIEKDVRIYEKPGPRILFYGGLRPFNWKIRNQFNKTTLSLSQYAYAGHFDDPLTPRWDLNWGMCKKYYYSWSNITENNLFKVFWGSYIDEITDRNSHLLTVNLILSELDMINLDIRDIIQVDNVHYRINKITHNPFNNKAVAELFRVKDSQAYSVKNGMVESIAPNWVPDPNVPVSPAPPNPPKPTPPIPTPPVWNPWVFPPDPWNGGIGTVEWITDVEDWGGSPWRIKKSLTNTYTTTTIKSFNNKSWVEPNGGTWRDSWNDVPPPNDYSPLRSKDLVNNNSYSNMMQVSVFGRDNNIAPTANAVRIQGNNNFISEDVSNVSIVGNNNDVVGGVSNVMVVGDNQIVNQSNVSIINGVKTDRLTTNSQRKKVQSPPNSVGVKSRVINGGINSSKSCLIVQGGQDTNNVTGMPVLPKQADDLVVKVGP